MPFLVRPGDRLDAEPGAIRVVAEGARQFERVDDAERAVQPAAARLRLAVRADQQSPLGIARAADHVSDAVDHRVEPRLGEFVGEPLARGDIDGRIGRPVDAGLVAAEFGEALQVGEQPFTVDLGHAGLR